MMVLSKGNVKVLVGSEEKCAILNTHGELIRKNQIII